MSLYYDKNTNTYYDRTNFPIIPYDYRNKGTGYYNGTGNAGGTYSKYTTKAKNGLGSFYDAINSFATGIPDYFKGKGMEDVLLGRKNLLGADNNVLNWNARSGAKVMGQSIGTAANVINAGVQGVNALNTLGDNNGLRSDADKLQNLILASYSNNPLANDFLTSDQVMLLNKLRRGNDLYDADAGDFFSGMGDNVGNILKNTAIGGLTGGWGGALIGGIGSAINSGLDGNNQALNNDLTQLEALYQALQEAEMQYKTMKRPNLNGLGIQQQYRDMYR